MAFVKVGSYSALPPGSLLEVTVGDETYALCNSGGTVYALSGACPHQGGPLGQGAFYGHTLVCPLHAWEFDCRSGGYLYDPDLKVPTFPVRIEGDDILIDIP